jgi:hypothetical protein
MKPPRIRTGEPKMKPKPKPARPAKPRARATAAQIKRIAGMRGRIAF